MKDSTGREVVDCEFDSNSDGTCYLRCAYYKDDGSEVPDGELDYLTDAYPEVMDEAAFDKAIIAADSLYDSMKD